MLDVINDKLKLVKIKKHLASIKIHSSWKKIGLWNIHEGKHITHGIKLKSINILVLTYVEEATMLAQLNLKQTNSQRCSFRVAYFCI